ncbi:MAG TPA: tripartite tricarboxylate transporter substrate binding protein [Bacillota bacterium]|mgnify:CR=1 FL=1|nr:tripartite tricarboxylate transporter substrate binding protein [Bacillota bacterium]
MKRIVHLLCLLVAFGLILIPVLGEAADRWPSKPITMIVGWGAGGGSDVTARMLAPYVEEIIGGKIIVVNKPGASGELSFTELARAKPDGYTIAWTNTPESVLLPVVRETQFELEDFAMIANIIDDPGVIAVRSDSPFQTLDDLIAYAKENPGKLTIGDAGIWGDDYIAVLLFCKGAGGLKVNQVSFDGGGPNIVALLGGHIDACAVNASEIKPHEEAGKVRVLAVMGDERCHILPDVPTFRELGYDVVSGSARGISFPAGTPKEIVDKMANAVKEALENPEFLEKAKAANLLIKYMGPEEYTEYLYGLRDVLTELYHEVAEIAP